MFAMCGGRSRGETGKGWLVLNISFSTFSVSHGDSWPWEWFSLKELGRACNAVCGR